MTDKVLSYHMAVSGHQLGHIEFLCCLLHAPPRNEYQAYPPKPASMPPVYLIPQHTAAWLHVAPASREISMLPPWLEPGVEKAAAEV
jgi:hypothetical protein